MLIKEFPLTQVLLVYLAIGAIRMFVRVCQAPQYPLRERWRTNLYGWPYHVLNDFISWVQWRYIMLLPAEDVSGVLGVLGARTFSCDQNVKTGEYIFTIEWSDGRHVRATVPADAMKVSTVPGHHLRAVAWFVLRSPKERI